MNLADLEKYIGDVEKRLSRALGDAEKRINTAITSAEGRLNNSTGSLDICIKSLKKKVGEVSNLEIEFRNHKENHVLPKQVNDLESSLKSHIDGHKRIKEYRELGITKFRVYAFIFFAFVAMGISIWNAFLS